MSEWHNSKLAIVGGGCSGLLTAVQLIRNGFRGRLTVLEPREQLGAGLAYSTSFDQHLLNVPAGKMSALPDQPADFLNWLLARHFAEVSATWFAPRRLYGEYLRDVLDQTIHANAESHFSHIRAEVIGARADASGVQLALHDGTTLAADKVVLALGNPASSNVPGVSDYGAEHHWHISPWSGDALRVRFPGERVLLLGTGLTAVDSALALYGKEGDCRVYMLSRRGLLPSVHDPRVQAGEPPVLRSRGNLRQLLRELRGHIHSARQEGQCWRAVVDALRPISNELWRELSAADQRRFLRHLRSYWESHRHRMAPEIRTRLDGYLASGALRILAGRLQDVRSLGNASEVRIRPKKGIACVWEVDRIINCTGIHENYTDNPRPLIRSLIENGLARANELGSGFRTDRHGALLNAEMRPSSRFFTLGSPRRGELFETTAVPEIRAQATDLAAYLLREPQTHPAAEYRPAALMAAPQGAV